MKQKLHYNTVTPLLKSILGKLMGADEFGQFRLVGGTALSLYCGHRMSVDIDLFTEAEYGTINFNVIENYLIKQFSYTASITFLLAWENHILLAMIVKTL